MADCPANGILSPHDGLPVYTGLTEPLGTTFKLMFYSGLAAASPGITVTAFYIIRPALPRRQKRAVALFIPALFLCFLAGLAFAYYLMLPVSIQFLVSFAEGFAVPTIRISEYLGLVMSLAIWLGVIFELPLVMFLLVKFRIIPYERFKRIHRFVYPVALIFSAIITPGLDPVASLMLFVPIVVLYQAGLLLSWLAQPGKGTVMLHAIKALAIGILRRVAAVMLLPLVMVAYVLAVLTILLASPFYLLVSIVLFLWYGYTPFQSPTRSKAWVTQNRMHRRVRLKMRRLHRRIHRW